MEHFFRSLPGNDPIAAQERIRQALADFCTKDNPERARLRALLTLDVRARPVLDALLVNLVPGNPQPRSIEASRWQGAFELVRALAGAHGHALRTMRESLLTNCREHLPLVLLRLFEHRRMELVLRPFVDERSTRFPWKDVHATYKLARSVGLLHASFPVNRPLDRDQTETTLEREYIVVLMQDLVNAGQLPPQEAFAGARCLLRWSQRMQLEQAPVGASQCWFGIDVDGDGGPARDAQPSANGWRYFDTSPALRSIDAEMASSRDGTSADEDRSLPPIRCSSLLRKLAEILKPERPAIVRRGDRRPVALTVQVVVGMAQIVRALRNRPDDKVVAPRPALTNGGDEMFTTTGGFTEMKTGTFPTPDGRTTSPAPGALDAQHSTLMMADRSESGCRLHGPADPSNPILPGMLVAFREASAGSWTIGVVRRFRKRLGGKRVEFGVEFIGSDARRVVLAPGAVGQGADQPEARKGERFAAIYIPESANYPILPIKTLILPSRGLKANDRLSVRARACVYTIVLKEAFEEQADFLWSPFDIVDRWSRDDGESLALASP